LKSEHESDQRLVVRSQQGDKRAFDVLVLKYQQRIASIVSRYLRDQDEVADVTQEAFIKAYRAWRISEVTRSFILGSIESRSIRQKTISLPSLDGRRIRIKTLTTGNFPRIQLS